MTANYRIMQEKFDGGFVRFWVEKLVAGKQNSSSPKEDPIWVNHIPKGRKSKYCSLEEAKVEIADLKQQAMIGEISIYEEFE